MNLFSENMVELTDRVAPGARERRTKASVKRAVA